MKANTIVIGINNYEELLYAAKYLGIYKTVNRFFEKNPNLKTTAFTNTAIRYSESDKFDWYNTSSALKIWRGKFITIKEIKIKELLK